MVCLLKIFAFGELIFKSIILINRFTITFHTLIFHAIHSKFILGTKNQYRQVFPQIGVRIVAQCILGSNNTSLVVVTQIIPQVVIKPGRKIPLSSPTYPVKQISCFGLHLFGYSPGNIPKIIATVELHYTSPTGQDAVREYQDTMPYRMETGQFRINAPRIYIIILDESLGCRLIIFLII